MKVHFRIYLIVGIVGSSQILLDCVWPFELRDQVIGLRLDPHYEKRAESPITVP